MDKMGINSGQGKKKVPTKIVMNKETSKKLVHPGPKPRSNNNQIQASSNGHHHSSSGSLRRFQKVPHGPNPGSIMYPSSHYPTFGSILHPLDLRSTQRPNFDKYFNSMTSTTTSTTTHRPHVVLNIKSVSSPRPTGQKYGSVNHPIVLKTSGIINNNEHKVRDNSHDHSHNNNGQHHLHDNLHNNGQNHPHSSQIQTNNNNLVKSHVPKRNNQHTHVQFIREKINSGHSNNNDDYYYTTNDDDNTSSLRHHQRPTNHHHTRPKPHPPPPRFR